MHVVKIFRCPLEIHQLLRLLSASGLSFLNTPTCFVNTKLFEEKVILTVHNCRLLWHPHYRKWIYLFSHLNFTGNLGRFVKGASSKSLESSIPAWKTEETSIILIWISCRCSFSFSHKETQQNRYRFSKNMDHKETLLIKGNSFVLTFFEMSIKNIFCKAD